jgi:hypothetical protein
MPTTTKNCHYHRREPRPRGSMALALAAKGIDAIITYQANLTAADEVVAGFATARRKRSPCASIAAMSPGFRNSLRTSGARSPKPGMWSRFDFLITQRGIGEGAAFADATEAVFDALNERAFQGRLLFAAIAGAAHHRRRPDHQRL